ncbi:hypothetical protein V8F20_009592 [Naviculisporaceae sp. PSN 640]
MESFNNNIISCLSGCGSSPIRAPVGPLCSKNHPSLMEKPPRPTPPPSTTPNDGPNKDPDSVVAEIITLLRTAEKKSITLTNRLDETVGTEGWTEWIAQKIFASLEDVLREGREKLGLAMQTAYDAANTAAEAVFNFKRDHPVAFAGLLTIIAVGILVVLAPVVVEALGFAELGPVEGSFAAWWESTYAGFIPKGSLFSYLQRLGMVWGRA